MYYEQCPHHNDILDEVPQLCNFTDEKCPQYNGFIGEVLKIENKKHSYIGKVFSDLDGGETFIVH